MLEKGIREAVSAASVLLVVAVVSVGVMLHSAGSKHRASAALANETVQMFLAGGATGVRTWEVFVGRQGAVCGCTTAPGDEKPRNFVAIYSPPMVALEGTALDFDDLWLRHCASTARTVTRRILAAR